MITIIEVVPTGIEVSGMMRTARETKHVGPTSDGSKLIPNLVLNCKMKALEYFEFYQ